MTLFVTKATPISYINSKCHKTNKCIEILINHNSPVDKQPEEKQVDNNIYPEIGTSLNRLSVNLTVGTMNGFLITTKQEKSHWAG